MTRRASRRGLKKSVAFFDIDGTLTDGFTIFSFAEFLRQKGLLLASCFSLMQHDKVIYQSSQKAEWDYHEFAVNLVDHYAQGLEGQSTDDVISLSPVFLDAALKNRVDGYRIHGFARDLVETMNGVASTVAISGSPWESLSGLVAHLNFQDVHATLLEVQHGKFTGRVSRNMALRESKAQLVSSYLAGEFNRNTSFAFGDSVQDVPLFEMVGNAFVLGGNRELGKMAGQRGWDVISAEDDIIRIVRERIPSLFGA